MTAPRLVVDFDLGDARPSPRELVVAAAEREAAFLACEVVESDDATPQARVGGRVVAGLARLADEASRRRVGLFLRVEDTLALHGLADALGAKKGDPASGLRDRVLVVVPGERVGRRLRSEAPELPSALELSKERRGLARFFPANMQRAAADADDLVVPWTRPGAASLVARIAPTLARRGARLWVSDLQEGDAARVPAVGVAGLVVRVPFPTPERGV